MVFVADPGVRSDAALAVGTGDAGCERGAGDGQHTYERRGDQHRGALVHRCLLSPRFLVNQDQVPT
jgi:hypothetical protein